MSTAASSPPCRILLRSKDGVELYKVPSAPPHERNFLLKGTTTLQVLAPNGRCAYFHQPGVGVVLRSLKDEEKAPQGAFLENSQKVQLLDTSPKGTHLVTWEKMADPQTPNLKVWNAKTGEYEHGFVQKNVRKDAWPYLQWTHDERYAFLLATNEVRVYEGNAFEEAAATEVRYVDKMRCQGVSSMSVPSKAASDLGYLLTAFCPKTKDKPGRVSLLQYPTTAPKNNNAYPAIASKSLYQVEEVAVHWSPRGDSALVAMQTSVDTTGESYYGSATIHLFHSNSSDAVSVPLPNNSTGPVLDVAWMPNPTKPPCFCVISGKMPSMASLHHGTTAEPLFLFGNAHRNTTSWSSHGRFLCCAGFGNLQGGMSFWDRNKLKVIPQYDLSTGKAVENPQPVANCTVGYGWSPDSRMFYSSTTSPRMNVDNGIRLFRYNGELLSSPDVVPWKNEWYQPDRLLEAAFCPSPDNTYPDRPQSPPPKGIAAASESGAAAALPAPAPKKPAGRYVPPGARGRGSGGTSLAERMRREKEGSMMGATKVKPSTVTVGGGTQKVIPGMTPTTNTTTKSKNALRKERQRAAKAKKAEEEARLKAEQEKADAAAAADPEKRARKIKKTLKQIEELKAKTGADLNEDQKKKLANEASLREELVNLGF